MKKRGGLINRKGQSTEFLILLIVAVVAAVLVIIGVSGGFNAIFEKIGLVPGSLQSTTEACKFYAGQSLSVDYCDEFRKINIAEKKQYVNCKYLKDSGYLSEAEEVLCSEEKESELAIEFCINSKLKGSDIINGQLCSEIANCEIEGRGVWTVPDEDGNCPTSMTKIPSLDKKTGQICCKE